MEDNCYVEPIKKISSTVEHKNIAVARLAVWGMGCPNCATRVNNSLVSQSGVLHTYVDHATGVALVKYDPDIISTDELIASVARAGGDGRHEYSAQLIP